MSWKRKGHKKPVELIFKFDSPRKFSKVNIFTANLLHLDIQVRVVSGAKMQKKILLTCSTILASSSAKWCTKVERS